MAKKTPIHPGTILACEFLEPMEISRERLARDLSVPSRRIGEIIRGNLFTNKRE
jgi:addiction module HigA family antidote